MAKISSPKQVIGWREWIALPGLSVPLLKAKVDTGARTSALHADDVEFFRRGAQRWVRFTVLPLQRSNWGAIPTKARLVEERNVRSSNGQQEVRPVITTLIEIGGEQWDVELTLTQRDVMGFRMLLGREAMRGRLLVDPQRSFMTRKVKRKK